MLKLFASQVGLFIDKKSFEQKSSESIKRVQSLLKNSVSIITIVDNKENYVDASDSAAELIGIKKEELIGKKFKEVLPEKSEEFTNTLSIINKTKKPIYKEEIYYVNNEEKIYESRVFPIEEKDNEVVLFGSIANDITAKKKDEKKIIEMKQRLENIIKGTNVGTWEWNIKKDNTIVNSKYVEMLGYTLEEISPMNIEKWEKLIHHDDLTEYQKKMKKIRSKEIEYYDIEIRIKHKNGKWKWINSRGKITKWSEDGSPVIMSGTHINITEKREKQIQIEYLGFHDYLTGLYNRRYMEDSIKRLDTNRNLPFSIIVSDVNGLKLTNDAYGHEMGDELLKVVAQILKNSCRQEDIICRAGGDEFVILLPGTSEEETIKILERIKKESENVKLDSVIVSLAVGSATKNSKNKNILDVYKEADNKMYKNKLRYGRIMRNKTIETVLLNINNKYDNEQLHTERVSQYCASIASAMSLGNREIEDAKIAGALHDIGKIIIPPEILNKENKLIQEEWEDIKKHPVTSYQLLKSVDEYAHLAEAVLYHHEKLDGTGYPENLNRDEIPILSRIISVADAFEAMTAKRPYQRTKTTEEAVEELKKGSGTQFDEKIVNIFINKVL